MSRRVTCTLFDGQRLRVVVPEIVGTDLRRNGLIEPVLTAVLVERLRPGMVFIDVGAHYGYFTLLAARRVWPSGSVVSFEPSRSTARLLEANVAHLDNVVVEEAALTDRGGVTLLRDFGPGDSALNTILPGARVPARERRHLHGDAYEVRAVRLDDYVAQQGLRPDVVKLDAEGAELRILSGMTTLLREADPLVALETGDYAGMASPPTSACIDLLATIGYSCLEARGTSLWPHRRRAAYGYGTLFFAKAGSRWSERPAVVHPGIRE